MNFARVELLELISVNRTKSKKYPKTRVLFVHISDTLHSKPPRFNHDVALVLIY